MEFKELDPILHAPLRLAVMSLLLSVKEAEFTFIKEKTNATAGNLSVQISKLKDAGYIEVTKQFKDNYPLTLCKITPKGLDAFENYVKALQTYMHPEKYGKRFNEETWQRKYQLSLLLFWLPWSGFILLFISS
jgi:DNA-binding transcriptional ArsR family regulator